MAFERVTIDHEKMGDSRKTVSTPNGPVTINVPRDRNGSFEPKIVPKRARRLGQIEEMILSFWSGPGWSASRPVARSGSCAG